MSTGTRYLHWLVGGSLVLSATLAFAGQITLFERPNFHGQSVSTDGSLPNLSRSGFNDTASSVIVRDGIWEACTDAYFHGSCVTLRSGEYRTLDATLNDRISSVRQVGYNAGPPRAIINRPPVVAAPQPEDARIVLSQHDGPRIRSIELTGSNPDLDSIGFSDRADAITVYGGVWRLCDREGGTGNCAEFPPGQYDRLGMLDGTIRSALFISDAPPVVAAPAAAPRVVLYEFPGFRGRSLAIEGGGMRGTVTAGMALALHELGLVPAFDAVYGSSAGAISGAWLLSSRPEGLRGWTEAHAQDDRGKKRTRAELDKLVKETVAKLKGGAKIEPLMSSLSEDPGSAKDGKPYDVTPDAGLVPPFKNLSLRLKVNEVGVVRTEYGMHIIQRVE